MTPPEKKTKIERLAEEWAEFGIPLKIAEHTPGTHIVTFFGAVPEEDAEESGEEEPAH